MGIVRHILGTKKDSKKRFWSDDEKRSICLQTEAPGVSVAKVARRNGDRDAERPKRGLWARLMG